MAKVKSRGDVSSECVRKHISDYPDIEQRRMMGLQDHDMEYRAKMSKRTHFSTISEDIYKQNRRK